VSRLAGRPTDDEDVDDDRTEQIDRTAYARHGASPGAGPGASAGGAGGSGSGARSLADWLNRTEEESAEDDELSFFSDHDTNRGSDGGGQFRTDAQHLEKVEVGGMGEGGSEVVEAEEAPVARYGAPVLTRGDALAKIDVANEVLSMVSGAFDDNEGPGRGRAVLQLLVDGVPSQFAVVLRDLQVSDTGELPSERVLRNLNGRPATEHRQLLNNSLVDIIERALSSAMDELSDEAVDQVLSSVAGYRQRLGL
jgi:hypothetical protein